MQECSKMRARTHYRVGTMTLKMTPLSKCKTRLMKQGTKMRMKMALKMRTKMYMRPQIRTKMNRRN